MTRIKLASLGLSGSLIESRIMKPIIYALLTFVAALLRLRRSWQREIVAWRQRTESEGRRIRQFRSLPTSQIFPIT